MSKKYRTLLLCLSYRCNIRCNVCSVGDLLDRPDRLSLEVAQRLIDDCRHHGIGGTLSFTGGEPFLVYKDMRHLMEYAHRSYGWRANITTNCTWAGNDSIAEKRLKPLAEAGLSALLISLDDSHLEQTSLESVENAIRVARRIGVSCQIQTVTLKGSRTAADFRQMLSEFDGDEGIIWRDSRCVPMGSAAEIDPSALIASEDVLMGGCSIYKFIAVMPNGDVGLCCSFFPSHLIVGNVHQHSMEEIIDRAENHLMSAAVFLWGGPKLVLDSARAAGMALSETPQYTNVCHACQEILGDERVVASATKELSPCRDEVLAMKQKAESEWGYNLDREKQKVLWSDNSAKTDKTEGVMR